MFVKEIFYSTFIFLKSTMRFDKLLFILLVLFPFLVILNNASASVDVPLTVVNTYVSTQRADVLATIYVGFRIVWSADNRPFTAGRVFLKDSGSTYITDANGWFFSPQTSLSIQTKTFSIDRIIWGADELSFNQTVPDPVCHYDKVIMELFTPHPRISVNESAVIDYNAFYATDYAPFIGNITLNHDTLTFSEIGQRTFEVVGISDAQYQVSDFESNDVEVIYDLVDVQLFSSRERVDVGAEAEFTWSAKYLSDNTLFQGNIYVNDSLVKNAIMKSTYSVESIYDNVYNVDKFRSNHVEVIHDKVLINLMVDDHRISVGDEASISWSANYAYDSTPFEGDLSYNNNNNFQFNRVGGYRYEVNSINDEKYGLTKFYSNSVDVIWDKVIILLEAIDSRINVGEDAEIIWSGYYEYDGSEFSLGSVDLNSNSYRNYDVSDFTYEVESIVDEVYGITSFRSNSLKVIWDEVEISIEFLNNVIEVGTSANPRIVAYYKYDMGEFNGQINLDNSLSQDNAGNVHYSIATINDRLHGLTSFDSNTASCNFDRVRFDEEIITSVPGIFRYVLTLYYQSSYTKISTATVSVNGKRASYIGEGKYVIELPNWMPNYKLEARVENPGFSMLNLFGYFYCYGNIFVIIFSSIIAIPSTIVLYRRNKRTQVFRQEQVMIGTVKNKIKEELSNVSIPLSLSYTCEKYGITLDQGYEILSEISREENMDVIYTRDKKGFMLENIIKKKIREKFK